MKNEVQVKGGDIFAIPLFLPKDDWKLKSKPSKKDYNKEFIFGRIIEKAGGSGTLVEIFNKVGSIEEYERDEVLSAKRLFSPIHIFLKGFEKKRWLVIDSQDNYDKEKDSDYSDIKFVLAPFDNLRLLDYDTNQETPVSVKDAKKYELSITWSTIDLEKRIVSELTEEQTQNLSWQFAPV